MFKVSRQCQVSASIETVWACLTETERLGLWFADADRLAPGEPCRFDFGDGDFFAGRMGTWRRLRSWSLEWRFMGLGPRYQIEVSLTPSASGTTVAVSDQGALTRATADGLDEGWKDFLERLARTASSGEKARYRWSPEIWVGLFTVGGADDLLARSWRDRSWWRRTFPTAEARLGDRVQVELEDPAWGGRRTRATLEVEATGLGAHAVVQHAGWAELPAAVQVAERRRYAESWAAGLTPLEARLEAAHA